MSKITYAQFSQQATYLAQEASHWAGDVLVLPENLQKPMREGSIERFLEGMRGRLDLIENWAAEPETTTTTD